jgi:putative thioredoxin
MPFDEPSAHPKPGADRVAGRPYFGGVPMKHEIGDFARDVVARSQEHPVLVEFWAPWHEPSRRLGRLLPSFCAGYSPRLDYARVNVEMHPEVVDELKVNGVPTVRLFSRGRAVGEFTGVLPESVITEWLDDSLAGKIVAAAPADDE